MTAAPNKRLSYAERALQTCVHFTGTVNRACKAGVVYEQARDPNVAVIDGLPCLAHYYKGTAGCAKREFPTREQVEAHEREIHARLDRFAEIRAAIVADGRSRGSIVCPACRTGMVGFSIASNGHVWAKCSTPDCAKWME